MIRPKILCRKWHMRSLDEVVEFLDHLRKPVKEKDRVPGPYPYYGANGQRGTINGYLFDEPLVLLAEDGGHFGVPGKPIAYQVDGKCWVNNHAHVLRPRKSIDIRFLCHQLEHYDVTSFISGTTRAKLTKRSASRIPVVIPPLPEQRRIAAILDKADAIRRKRQEAIRLTDEFLRSAFLDMFGDPTTNPKEWETKPIKKIGKVVTGNTPSRKKQEYYGDHIEWIKSNNINTPFHFLTEADEYLSQQGKQVGRSVPAYSILVSCIAGTPECIGNAALTDREVAFNQQINAIVPFKYTDPYFLYSQLLVAKKLVQRESTNSMKGLVSKSKFEKIKLLIPRKEKQNKFREIFMQYLTLHERQTKLQMESDFLFDSSRQRAFRGEL